MRLLVVPESTEHYLEAKNRANKTLTIVNHNAHQRGKKSDD